MSQQTDSIQALTTLRDAINTCLEAQPLVECWLSVTVRNEANLRDRWGGVSRAKAHRTAARLVVQAATSGVWPCADGLVVLLVRVYSGRQQRMDDDGAWRSTKAVQDGVADALGVDDADPRVAWVPTQQERGKETGVRVQIYARRPQPGRGGAMTDKGWVESV